MKHVDQGGTIRNVTTGAGASGPIRDQSQASWSVAVGGGNVTLTLFIGGVALETLVMTPAEAATLGSKLGGTGGTASTGNGP